jgi:hypothetical protein
MRSLKQGRNVIINGRSGVGRSCLVKHIAKLHSGAWQFLFADFSKPASQSCNDLIHQLFPRRGRLRRNRYTRLMQAKDILLGKKLTAHLPRVVVLDNIGKISHQKLAFIQDMRFDGELMFTAIAESFLSEDDLFRLRAVLYPSDLQNLRNLSKAETTSFFRKVSNIKNLGGPKNLSKCWPLQAKATRF